MESLLWSLRFGSTFVTVMGFGHCLYISAVEVTARRRLPTPNSMIDHFQATFPLAKKYSQGLGAIPTLMSVAHYFLNPEHPSSKLLLFAGLSIISIGPYTKLFILPTNHLLLDGESKILEKFVKLLCVNICWWFDGKISILCLQIPKRREIHGFVQLWMTGPDFISYELWFSAWML